MSSKGLYAIATSAAILGSSILSLPAHAVVINDLFGLATAIPTPGLMLSCRTVQLRSGTWRRTSALH